MPLHPDFQRLYVADAADAVTQRWLLFRGEELLVRMRDETVFLPDDTAAVQQAFGPLTPIVLGRTNGIGYGTAEVSSERDLPDNWRALPLRRIYGQIPDQEWEIAGYASQVLHWLRTSRFCPVCGTPPEPMQQEWMRRCGQCGHERYPPVSPAVLILVHDGADRVLLSHKPGWGDMRSILAGFVLPGEALEECVHREVEEEVGVRVTDLVYQGSQPWPFPHQLMIGFTARYVDGEIRIDEQELDAADWFHVDALPMLPSPMSLSRQMLNAWIHARRPLQGQGVADA